MERERNNLQGQPEANSSGFTAWDAVPRDGPAVFVVDAVAYDRGQLHGRWIRTDEDPAAIEGQLHELLGQCPRQGNWAIIDQAGLGTVMMPESLPIEELPAVAAVLAAEASP